jgi:hypothetical protein
LASVVARNSPESRTELLVSATEDDVGESCLRLRQNQMWLVAATAFTVIASALALVQALVSVA